MCVLVERQEEEKKKGREALVTVLLVLSSIRRDSVYANTTLPYKTMLPNVYSLVSSSLSHRSHLNALATRVEFF